MDPSTIVTSAPTFMEILKMVLSLGPIGLVLIVWYFDKQKTDEVQRQSDVRLQAMFDLYSKDMQELRDMYTTNASLVKRYVELAGDLKEVVTLNTQAMTRLVDRIDKERKHE
ncbi:hypothetical protein [uncultured Desulfobacter sp.]|uniref:hypothetical protein n=1 Tax=uncultured Desulfobacter sp. TaxID=240139 RepID=UPI002AAAF87C|nr:hypothetical protein [uncultured Desulfobacter sp.]